MDSITLTLIRGGIPYDVIARATDMQLENWYAIIDMENESARDKQRQEEAEIQRMRSMVGRRS